MTGFFSPVHPHCVVQMATTVGQLLQGHRAEETAFLACLRSCVVPPVDTDTNFDTAAGRHVLDRIVSDWSLYLPNPSRAPHHRLVCAYWLQFYGHHIFGRVIATHGVTHWPSLVQALSTAMDTLEQP